MNAVVEKARKADMGRVRAVTGLRQRWSAMPKPWRYGVVAALIVLLYYLPALQPPLLYTPGTDFTTVLFLCAVYVLIAVGLNVVVGLAGLLDLGYVGFYAVGAYSVAILGSPDSPIVVKFPWIVCVPLAIAIAMVSGVLLGWPTLRLRGDYLAIVTLGFGEIIANIATFSGATNGTRGIGSVPQPSSGTWPAWMNWFPGAATGQPIFDVAHVVGYYWLALTVVLICVLGVRRLEHSRVGRSWLAIREDEEAAEIMGVRTTKFKLWAFSVGAFIGGLGGVLFSGEQGFINSSTFVLQFSILVLAGVVMGGSGNIAGAILGGALISYIPDRLRGISDPFFHTDLFGFRFAIFGVVIILIMIFRPQGLIPSRRRVMELRDREKEVAPVE
jgi:branched-chain amino acid transport system permease protein